jgi:hypothetical protein
MNIYMMVDDGVFAIIPLSCFCAEMSAVMSK